MVRPKNALDPDSQPWARSIEADIDRLLFDATKSALDTSSAFKSLNSSLILLSNLVNSQVSIVGNSSRVFDFALSAAPTLSIGSTVSLSKPEWANKAIVTVIGTAYLVTNTTAALPNMNVYIDGQAGMGIDMARVDAASAVPYSSTNAHTLVLDPCPETIECQTAFYVINPADYYTGEANRRVQTSATAIFTR